MGASYKKAETHRVEVSTENGVRLVVLFYFVALLTLVVRAGRVQAER